MTTPRIYFVCLSAHTNGLLHGKWVNCEGNSDDIMAGINAMLVTSPMAKTQACEELTYIKEVKGIEEAYEQWVKDRQAEGELKSVHQMVRSKFKLNTLTPEVEALLAKLDEQQLSALI